MQDQDRRDNSEICNKCQNKDENRILDNKITQSFLFLILLFCVLLPFVYRSSEEVEVPRESIDYIKVKFRESREDIQESEHINIEMEESNDYKNKDWAEESLEKVDSQNSEEIYQNKEDSENSEKKEEQEKHADTDDISNKKFEDNSEVNSEVINTAKNQIGDYSRDPGFKATDESVEDYNRSLDVKFL
jgi:hypothetical protein